MIHLRQYYDLLSGYVVGFDGFAKNNFGETIGVCLESQRVIGRLN